MNRHRANTVWAATISFQNFARILTIVLLFVFVACSEQGANDSSSGGSSGVAGACRGMQNLLDDLDGLDDFDVWYRTNDLLESAEKNDAPSSITSPLRKMTSASLKPVNLSDYSSGVRSLGTACRSYGY
jgi:hypothetical protein